MPNVSEPDDLHQALIDARRHLTNQQSQALSARMAVPLGKHFGGFGVLKREPLPSRGS